MSKPEHSPLPWKIEDGGSPDWLDGIRCQYAIRTDDGNTIAYVFDKPDAEAIINNQKAIAELVEALEMVRDGNAGCQPGYVNTMTLQLVSNLINKHKAKP